MIELIAFTPVVTPLGDLCVSVEYVSERGIQQLQPSLHLSDTLASGQDMTGVNNCYISLGDHRTSCPDQSLSSGLDMSEDHPQSSSLEECALGGPDITDNTCSAFSVSLYQGKNGPELITDYISPFRSANKDQKAATEALHPQTNPSSLEGMVRRNSWGSANPLR